MSGSRFSSRSIASENCPNNRHASGSTPAATPVLAWFWLLQFLDRRTFSIPAPAPMPKAPGCRSPSMRVLGKSRSRFLSRPICISLFNFREKSLARLPYFRCEHPFMFAQALPVFPTVLAYAKHAIVEKNARDGRPAGNRPTLHRLGPPRLRKKRRQQRALLYRRRRRGVPLARESPVPCAERRASAVPRRHAGKSPLSWTRPLKRLRLRPSCSPPISPRVGQAWPCSCDDVLLHRPHSPSAMKGCSTRQCPQGVSLCVLIHRGTGNWPIEAQYVGRKVQTSGHRKS